MFVSVQAALAVQLHSAVETITCPCTNSCTPLRMLVSARLETATWYMASRLVGGIASENTE